MRTIFVEKDYWITILLSRLSKSAHSDEIVFKGGTSLSKVHKLIARFSEDVDLAILRSEDRLMITKGQLLQNPLQVYRN